MKDWSPKNSLTLKRLNRVKANLRKTKTGHMNKLIAENEEIGAKQLS